MARKNGKSGKRGNKEGTVFEDSQGRWWAQLPVDERGKRPKRRATTQAEAIKLLAQMKGEQARGVDLTEINPTLASFLELWLTDVIAPTLRASTLIGYREVIKRQIAPALGRVRLDKLTPPMCQRWVNELRKEFAASTVRRAAARLKSALDIAKEWYSLPRNPMDSVRLPPLGASAARTYTIEQIRALFTTHSDWRLVAILHVLFLLGLRRGEALGLAWRDWDRKRQTIKVTQQVQETGGKVHISGDLKSKNAERLLPVPPGLAALLAALWDERQDERKRRGVEWKEHGLIFCNDEGGPIWPSNFNLAFKRLCEVANVPTYRVHDCRHTCATLLGEQGATESIIGALLGHTPATVTRRYAHVKIDMLREEVERLERMITGSNAESSGLRRLAPS